METVADLMAAELGRRRRSAGDHEGSPGSEEDEGHRVGRGPRPNRLVCRERMRWAGWQ